MKYFFIPLIVLVSGITIVIWSKEQDNPTVTTTITPEEQGYPEYIFQEEKIEDMTTYLINEVAPIEWAVKYEALKKRVPVHYKQFNTTTMEVRDIDSFEYVNNIDWEFRYKVTNNSGEINFYKIKYIIEWDVSVPYFIPDDNYFF